MEDVAGAVRDARNGSAEAWAAIVDGYSGLVWSVVRGFRFDADTSKDVFQTVWLRLAEHLHGIRDPEKLAGWLGQTTRNECVGVVRQRDRVFSHDEVIDLGVPIDATMSAIPMPGDDLEIHEQRQAVAAAFGRLGDRCQRLLALLVSDPPTSYVEISKELGLPVGSIGPTRARCLASLRSTPEISRITGGVHSS